VEKIAIGPARSSKAENITSANISYLLSIVLDKNNYNIKDFLIRKIHLLFLRGISYFSFNMGS
jgi:hypothetical protein